MAVHRRSSAGDDAQVRGRRQPWPGPAARTAVPRSIRPAWRTASSTRLTYWAESWARVSRLDRRRRGAGRQRGCAAVRPLHVGSRASDALSGGTGTERLLPYGPVADLSLGAGQVALLNGNFGSFGADPAHRKRYRGGTAGRLWVGSPAGGDTPFRRVLADLPGQFASPMIAGGRLAFLSDHEGTGNIYSCAPDGTGLRRHTDHDGWYARQASTDGQRIIYARGGELWLLDDAGRRGPRRLEIMLGSPASGREPRLISAEDHVGSLSVDVAGTASAVEVRGTVHWLTHRDGPAGRCRSRPESGRGIRRCSARLARSSGRPTPTASTRWSSAPVLLQPGRARV